MSDHGQRMCELAQEAADAEEPERALRALAELRRELDAFARVQVRRGFDAGRSSRDLARALGISRQAAHRRYRDLAPRRPRVRRRRLVATDDVHRVLRLAHEEAVAAGAPAIGSQHVLVGIVRTDHDAARALRSEGVTLEAARACGRIDADRDRSRGDGDDLSSVRLTLQRALRVGGDRELDVEQLLLAALADPDDGANRTLTALGVTPASVRARLGC